MGFEESDLVEESDGKMKSFVAISCSICLEEVVIENGDRSWAKLQCGHQFHLDCIGSAFNVKGVMQCPNCRKIEKGQWLFANGSRPFQEFNMEEWTPHDEDLYDLSYSETSFGVHWCPYDGLTRVPVSYEDGVLTSTGYHELIGQHAVFSEHGAMTSASHPCPYITYLGPIHPSSSNSTVSMSDNSVWNGPAVPNEAPSSFGFPTVDYHHHSWDHHFTPFSGASQAGGSEQTSLQPVAQRSSRTNSDLRTSNMPPFVSFSSNARGGSSGSSQTVPPYQRSNVRARDRVQALQAYYQQPNNSAAARTPPLTSSRRSTQSNRFYVFPPGASSNFVEAESQVNHFPARDRDLSHSFPSNQAERAPSWGTFHRPRASDGGTWYRPRIGSGRTSTQNRSWS